MRPWPLSRSTSISTWPLSAASKAASIIGLQGRLIAFDGEQIVGSGVADGSGDLRIAGDGVDGGHGAFEAAAGGEFLEQQRDRGRFVGRVVDGLLPENQMAVGGDG